MFIIIQIVYVHMAHSRPFSVSKRIVGGSGVAFGVALSAQDWPVQSLPYEYLFVGVSVLLAFLFVSLVGIKLEIKNLVDLPVVHKIWIVSCILVWSSILAEFLL